MNIMEPLSKELQDNQYYVTLLDELVQENDMELKHRLQKADTYSQFINEQAALLIDETIICQKENELSFFLASAIVVELWKKRMFN